jgi:hypothetical protein
MVILLAYDNRFNTNIIARNTLKEVDREVKEANRGIQKVSQGVEELKNDSAAQKAHKKGELLAALHPQPIHACAHRRGMLKVSSMDEPRVL